MSGIARLPARAALAAIRFYQRRLSPHKGFHCALRAVTGADGCSAYGHAVIARFGLLRGVRLLRRRLDLCGAAYRSLPRTPPSPPLPRSIARQRGFCDLPCDAACHVPCDLPCHHGSGGGLLGDLLGCACDGSNCGSSRWSRKRQGDIARHDARIGALSERVRQRKARLRDQDRAR